MLLHLIFLAANSLLYASCYYCNPPVFTFTIPDFSAFGFGRDVIDTVGDCIRDLAKKPDPIRYLINLWPAFDTISVHNCIGKGLAKGGYAPVVKDIAKQMTVIPTIGGPIAALTNMFSSNDYLDKLKEELKQEIRNSNVSILCAVGIETEALREEIIGSEERLNNFVNSKVNEMNKTITEELQNIRREIVERLTVISSRLYVVIKEMQDIVLKLEGIEQINAQVEEMKFFSKVRFPLESLKNAYGLMVNYSGSDDFVTMFSKECMENSSPMNIIENMREILSDNNIEEILKVEVYSEDIYKHLVLSYYDALMEAGEMLYSCDTALTYDEKQIQFTDYAQKISVKLIELSAIHNVGQ